LPTTQQSIANEPVPNDAGAAINSTVQTRVVAAQTTRGASVTLPPATPQGIANETRQDDRPVTVAENIQPQFVAVQMTPEGYVVQLPSNQQTQTASEMPFIARLSATTNEIHARYFAAQATGEPSAPQRPLIQQIVPNSTFQNSDPTKVVADSQSQLVASPPRGLHPTSRCPRHSSP
jgi:hypothetical protein